MRDSTAAAWPESITSYEGRPTKILTDGREVTWLYWDTHDPILPTTGTGNMIGSNSGLSSFGLSLPWRNADGNYLAETQVQAEALRLRDTVPEKSSAWTYGTASRMFLDNPEVPDWLLWRETDAMWASLKGQLPTLEGWPADAQLAIANMAWWLGNTFLQTKNADGSWKWPNLRAALLATDFYKASLNCTASASPSQRNPDNVLRFETAARIVYAGLDAEQVYNPSLDDADDPIYPQHPLSGRALLTVSASDISRAVPTVRSIPGWYFQRWLLRGSYYAGPLDGLVGPMTLAAFTAWAKATKQVAARTVASLTLLSNQADRMKVTT